MAGDTSKKAQPPVVDNILQYGKQAFDPELAVETREANFIQFTNLIERFA
jgi:hypothetical protein